MIRMIRSVALVAALSLGFAATQAQAAFSGSFAVGGLNTAGPTIGTAGTYTFTGFSVQSNGVGQFAPPPPGVTAGDQFTLGTLSFSTTTGGLSFGSTTDGTFTETGTPTLTALVVGQTETFFLAGNYTGGAVGASTPASFILTFNFNGGSLSSSGVVAIPPAPVPGVPEPASVVMLGLGLAGFCGYGLRRRMAK